MDKNTPIEHFFKNQHDKGVRKKQPKPKQNTLLDHFVNSPALANLANQSNPPKTTNSTIKEFPIKQPENKPKKEQKIKVALVDLFHVLIKPSNRAIAMVLSRIPQSFYNLKTNEWQFGTEFYEKVSLELSKSKVKFESIPPGTLMMVRRTILDKDISSLRHGIYGTLHKFQREAVQFAINRNGRVLLADDMGLGKTVQALAIAKYYYSDFPLLIIAPSSLLCTWYAALQQFLDESPQIIRSRDDISAPISIISYTQAASFSDELRNLNAGVIICDECHYLKSATSKRTKNLLPLLQSATRLIMISGTPALSRPLELYPIFMALDKRLFPHFTVYGSRYCNGRKIGHFYDYRGCSNANELSLALEHAFMIRRVKSEVSIELPKKFRRQVYLNCEKIQLNESIFSLIGDVINRTESQIENEITNNLSANSSVEQTILVEFSNAVKTKIGPVLEYLSGILEKGTKTVIFAHHQEMLNGIEEYCKIQDYKYVRVDGTTPSAKRHAFVERFQNEEDTKIALLSITACSAGITLTAAKLLIFAELYWNPGTLLQAEDRIHRIGQKSDVDIHYLLGTGTVDEYVWPHILKKLNVLESLGLGTNELKYVKSEEKDTKRIDQYFNK